MMGNTEPPPPEGASALFRAGGHIDYHYWIEQLEYELVREVYARNCVYGIIIIDLHRSSVFCGGFSYMICLYLRHIMGCELVVGQI